MTDTYFIHSFRLGFVHITAWFRSILDRALWQIFENIYQNIPEVGNIFEPLTFLVNWTKKHKQLATNCKDVDFIRIHAISMQLHSINNWLKMSFNTNGLIQQCTNGCWAQFYLSSQCKSWVVKTFRSVDMATISISMKIPALSYGFRARPLVNFVIWIRYVEGLLNESNHIISEIHKTGV